MKLIPLLAGSAIALSAAMAAEQIRIETRIAGKEPDGELLALAASGVVVEEGKEAVIRFGVFEYTMTPKLRRDGTVEIVTVITEKRKNESTVVAKPRTIVESGKSAEVGIGNIVVTLKPTRLK